MSEEGDETRYAIAEHHQNRERIGLEIESTVVEHQEVESAAELTPLLPFITGNLPMRIFQQRILMNDAPGMLTNLGAMDGEGMHRMLSAVASQFVSKAFTVAELTDFLDGLPQIEETGGVYKLASL